MDYISTLYHFYGQKEVLLHKIHKIIPKLAEKGHFHEEVPLVKRQCLIHILMRGKRIRILRQCQCLFQRLKKGRSFRSGILGI